MRFLAHTGILLLLAWQPVTDLMAGSGPRILPQSIEGELVLEGEHVLEGDVTVRQGGKLRILRGASVRAAAGASLTVQGELEISGTREDPVRIASEKGAAWKGISLLTGASGAVSHAELAGAKTAVSILAGRIEVVETTITGSETGIHLVKEARAGIRNVRFLDSRVGLAAEMRSSGEVSGCLFSGCGIGLGIASGAVPRVRGNRFENNDLGIQVLQRYPGRIEGNLFAGNRTGVRLYQNGPETVVERNRFENNTDAAVLAVSYTSPVIANNFMMGGNYGIYANQFSSPEISRNVMQGMENAIYLSKKSVSRVTGNIVAGSKVGLLCDFSSYPLLRENLFSGNDIHIRLGRFQSSDWESKAGSKRYVLQSAARQGSRNPKLGEAPEDFPEALDATGNWWDEKTLDEMTAKGPDADITSLYDGYDLPEVTYEGFGEESYLIDKILYLPALRSEPAGAGLEGWKGSADELALR